MEHCKKWVQIFCEKVLVLPPIIVFFYTIYMFDLVTILSKNAIVLPRWKGVILVN